jgi:hypothetical protein
MLSLQTSCLQNSSIQGCIRAVLQDEGFKIPSQEAETALKCATSLCKWLDGEHSKKNC